MAIDYRSEAMAAREAARVLEEAGEGADLAALSRAHRFAAEALDGLRRASDDIARRIVEEGVKHGVPHAVGAPGHPRPLVGRHK
jgi:hypothetical protein